jgi:hypothetical protein
MTVEVLTRQQEKLNQAAVLVNEVIDIAGEAGITEAQDKAADALRLMLRAGVASPFQVRGRRTDDGGLLAQLAMLDTPEARELLAALAKVQALAEVVDAQRGRALPPDLPLQAGESRGTDYAETISMMAARLRTEIHGPAGRESG